MKCHQNLVLGITDFLVTIMGTWVITQKRESLYVFQGKMHLGEALCQERVEMQNKYADVLSCMWHRRDINPSLASSCAGLKHFRMNFAG